MKLASLKSGRDGKLVVVSRDLTRAIDTGMTMQQALDEWDSALLALAPLAAAVEKGDGFAFDARDCASPLPRAYQWADGSVYINHVELARKARGAEMPESLYTDPLMYQGGSDSFLGPHDDIVFPTAEYGVDFEGEVAVITGDAPMGTTAADAAQYIRLVMLVNDISLRYIAQNELSKGFGFFQGKPSSAFSPVAVTPDELGIAWKDGMVHLHLEAWWNGQLFGRPHAGTDYLFNFPRLIEHAAMTRPLCAGTIIGSGTVSNRDRTTGHACIVEKRMIEKVEAGKSVTPFMAFGDTVKVDMKDSSGQSVFGTIEQTFNQS
jgi:fumarylacetoacetate (FAA) hydrolase